MGSIARRGSGNRDASLVRWRDEWVAKQPAAKFPKALAGAASQYSTRQAPSRGVSELLDSYRENSWLHAVVSKVAYHFAVVPWELYQKKPQSSGKRLSTEKFQALRGSHQLTAIAKSVRASELTEIEEHPLLDLLRVPNADMSGVAFRELCCKLLDLTGEVFLLTVKDGLGIPYQLWPIVPTWVFRIPNYERPYYQLSVMGRPMTVPADEMIYIRRHELLNPYTRGTGLGLALGDAIDMNHYTLKFMKSFYFNSAKPEAIISMPGASEDIIQDFQQKYENSGRGALRAHRTFFVDSEIDVKEMSNDTGAENGIPMLDHLRDTFISTFGVPPEIMGVLENANRATINQAMTIFARETLMPRLELFAAELQRQLVPQFDDRLLLAYANPVPEDDDFRLSIVKTAPWLLTAAEIRALGGWKDRGDADQYHMVPAGMTAVTDPKTQVLAPGQPAPVVDPAAPDSEPPVILPADSVAGYVAEVRKASDDIDPEDFADGVLEDFDGEALGDALTPVWEKQIPQWGKRSLEELGLDPSFDLENPKVVEFMDQFSGERVTGINETTVGALRAQLIDGVKAGEGYKDLAARVREVMTDASKARAEKIARTEVIRASNFASKTAYSESGLIDEKQWVATADDRTRLDHFELDGVVVGIDEDFEIGGATGEYPGGFDDPDQDCNCRCTIAPVVDEPKSGEALTKAWKAFDSRARAWESQAKGALREAFALQKSSVLKALRRQLDS